MDVFSTIEALEEWSAGEVANLEIVCHSVCFGLFEWAHMCSMAEAQYDNWEELFAKYGYLVRTNRLMSDIFYTDRTIQQAFDRAAPIAVRFMGKAYPSHLEASFFAIRRAMRDLTTAMQEANGGVKKEWNENDFVGVWPTVNERWLNELRDGNMSAFNVVFELYLNVRKECKRLRPIDRLPAKLGTTHLAVIDLLQKSQRRMTREEIYSALPDEPDSSINKATNDLVYRYGILDNSQKGKHRGYGICGETYES